MDKEKKPLTIKEKKKHYKKLEIACLVGEYAVVPIPFAVLAIINREEWFATNDGWKIGLGGGLALTLMMLIIFLITKNKEKEPEKQAEVGYITLMIGWAVGAAIFTLLSNIMDQIATIMWVGLSGIAAGFGMDIGRKEMRKKYMKNKNAIEEAEKQEMVAQASEERKVKVKVKRK